MGVNLYDMRSRQALGSVWSGRAEGKGLREGEERKRRGLGVVILFFYKR